MSENKIIQAPKISSQQLWGMSDIDFNDWRRKNDYPRIILFLKSRLPEFESWMTEQNVTDELLIKHSPSSFLIEIQCYYLYSVFYDNEEEKEIFSSVKYSIGEIFFHKNLVKERKDIIPYPTWYKQKNKKSAPDLYIGSMQGRSHLILHELELLDLGNIMITGLLPIGNRLLDFINVSDLLIKNCISNTPIKLWFCSAINLTIEGDLAFIDAHKTSFYDVFNLKYRNLKLLNGNFQSWKFNDCNVNFSATNAILNFWEFTGWDFNGTISNTDIKDCIFKSSPIQYPISYGRVKYFHAQIKRLYSQIGKKGEASKHFYLEKTYERKSFRHLKENFRNEFYKNRQGLYKSRFYLKYYFKYLYSGFQNILWGYGERPAREFSISIITIFLFALCYCYFPHSSKDTHLNFINSLYYSMVTFSTLGYGDITQSDKVLRLFSGLEAILGMSFWGILIAGFTNNTKDY